MGWVVPTIVLAGRDQPSRRAIRGPGAGTGVTRPTVAGIGVIVQHLHPVHELVRCVIVLPEVEDVDTKRPRGRTRGRWRNIRGRRSGRFDGPWRCAGNCRAGSGCHRGWGRIFWVKLAEEDDRVSQFRVRVCAVPIPQPRAQCVVRVRYVDPLRCRDINGMALDPNVDVDLPLIGDVHRRTTLRL